MAVTPTCPVRYDPLDEATLTDPYAVLAALRAQMADERRVRPRTAAGPPRPTPACSSARDRRSTPTIWFRKRERATFIAGFGQHLTIRALGNIDESRQHWRMSAVVG